MNNINTCKNGFYLGCGIAASPLIIGTLLTTHNAIHSLITGVFLSTLTGGTYTTAFNAVFFSSQIWTATSYTSCIGLPIAAISLIGMSGLYLFRSAK